MKKESYAIRIAKKIINNEHAFKVLDTGRILRRSGPDEEWKEMDIYIVGQKPMILYKRKFVSINKLIFGKHIGPLDSDSTIRHKDGKLLNCSASNLEQVVKCVRTDSKKSYSNDFIRTCKSIFRLSAV